MVVVTEHGHIAAEPDRVFEAITDTRMSVTPDQAGSVLTIAMEARGSTWFKRTMNVIMKPMFRRGIRSHMKNMATQLGASPHSD